MCRQLSRMCSIKDNDANSVQRAFDLGYSSGREVVPKDFPKSSSIWYGILPGREYHHELHRRRR